MTDESKKNGEEAGSSPDRGEPAPLAIPNAQEIEPKIEEILKRVLSEQSISPPQREQLVHHFREVFSTYVERQAESKLDPEIFKIAADTVYKDNENRFKWLSQKQTDAAAEKKREHDFEVQKHNDRFRIIRPAAYTIVIVFPICLFLGVYLVVNGYETLGTNILTGITLSVLSYIGGLGTADIVRGKKK